MTATVHDFPTIAHMSWRQRRERSVHHHYALLDLLTKPTHSAANLQRQLKVLVPASCGHARASDIQELVDLSVELQRLVDDLVFNISCDCVQLEHSLKQGEQL